MGHSEGHLKHYYHDFISFAGESFCAKSTGSSAKLFSQRFSTNLFFSLKGPTLIFSSKKNPLKFVFIKNRRLIATSRASVGSSLSR